MQEHKSLIVIADDFGAGPATSKGILNLAAQGRITGAGAVVSSPYVKDAVAEWRKLGEAVDLGWQACLTMDAPVLPAREVPSLVDANGRFYSFSRFIWRMAQGRIRRLDVQAELQAQWDRFRMLVGRPPQFVTGHEHVQLLPVVGSALLQLLFAQRPVPYFRRVHESLLQWIAVRGGRWKRFLLSTLGRRFRVKQARVGIPGNDYFAGVADPQSACQADLMELWLQWTPGQVVELACRPGHRDATLIHRAVRSPVMPAFCRCVGMGFSLEEQLEQRVREMELLQSARFVAALARSGRRLTTPAQVALEHQTAPQLRLAA